MTTSTTQAKYLVTDQRHPEKTRNGEPVFLVLKYGRPWAWLTSQQYHNFYHEGRIFPSLMVYQLA